MTSFSNKFLVPIILEITWVDSTKNVIRTTLRSNESKHTPKKLHGVIEIKVYIISNGKNKLILKKRKSINHEQHVNIGVVRGFSLGSGKILQNNSTPLRLGALRVHNELDIPLKMQMNKDYQFEIPPKTNVITKGDLRNDDPGIRLPSVLYDVNGYFKGYQIQSNNTDIIFGGVEVVGL